MTNAAERLAAIDSLPAAELCGLALDTLERLVVVMNEETVLMRSGRAARAGADVTAEKARLAQDYMGLARSVQRQAVRLKAEAPQLVETSPLPSPPRRARKPMAPTAPWEARARRSPAVSRSTGPSDRTHFAQITTVVASRG
jgi:hypothetical protein